MTSPQDQRYLLTHCSTATQGAPAIWVNRSEGRPDTVIVIETAEIILDSAFLTPSVEHGYLIQDVRTQLLKVIGPVALPKVSYAQASLIAEALDSGQVCVQMSTNHSERFQNILRLPVGPSASDPDGDASDDVLCVSNNYGYIDLTGWLPEPSHHDSDEYFVHRPTNHTAVPLHIHFMVSCTGAPERLMELADCRWLI